MIIEYCENEYSVKWKHDESDKWKTANLDDLIRAYETIYEPQKHSMSCKKMSKLFELRTCPYCNGLAGSVKNIYGTHYMIRCKDCGVQTKPFTREEKAIEAWNRRANNEYTN